MLKEQRGVDGTFRVYCSTLCQPFKRERRRGTEALELELECPDGQIAIDVDRIAMREFRMGLFKVCPRFGQRQLMSQILLADTSASFRLGVRRTQMMGVV